MTWTVDTKKPEATDEHGYKITWARNKHGTWFNAYSAHGRSIAAGYDREKVKAECELHRKMLADQRAMIAARKAATEVA